MKVACICEVSGTVRDAFLAAGHDTISCDIEPTDKPGPHIQGDCRQYNWSGYDLVIAFPPCTYLTVSGNKWMKQEFADRFPGRKEQRIEAINFFLWIAQLPVKRLCIENPVGIMSTAWRPPDQYIQPWQYGHPDSKKTGLWLKNLPALIPTKIVNPEWYITKKGKRMSQVDVNTGKLKGKDRQKARSKTYQGIAGAMAAQWGCL